MKALNIGFAGLGLLGLAACGGDGGDSNINNRFDYQLTPVAADERPWIILEGAKIDPKHLSFSIKRDYYDHGNQSSSIDEGTTTIDNSINAQMRDWLNSINKVNDIEVSADITSSDTSVIAFENGRLVAKALGKANLTVTLDTSKPLASVFDTSDIAFTGFQGTYEFGEVTVCPYVDVDLSLVSENVATVIQDEHAPLHAISYVPDTSDYSSAVFTSVHAFADVDVDKLAEAGLTIEDCTPQGKTDYGQPVSPFINGSTSFHADGFFTQKGVELLGFSFPNITMSLITSISSPQLTSVGYGGNLVLDALNPFTVEAHSNELDETIDISHFYLSANEFMNYYTTSLGLAIQRKVNNCTSPFCVDPTDANYTIQLTHPTLPNLSSEALPIKDGIADMKINKTSGQPGERFKVNSSLTVDGVVYDTSKLFFFGHSAIALTSAFFDNKTNDFSIFGNSFIVYKAHTGKIRPYTDDRFDINFFTGDVTDQAIRGRWVQADTGQDHYIAGHSAHNYTSVSNNLITYQTTDNKTARLLRAGIDNVAVSGNVNIVEEINAQANSINFTDSTSLARSITPQARSLSGIANIDLILTNVNSGDKTNVVVAQDGTFSEEVPTGVYDVEGTVVDGEITYAIDTQITVEKDATDTGKLNLAKVGLYNFDVSISGCEHGYKCYANKNYTFTVTAKNTGAIASSGIQATIGDLSGHANVTAFTVPGLPITGAARGDSINYEFSARFSQPAEDTVIEIPITLTDADARTWEDVVKIKLSKYSPLNVNIMAYNAGADAYVRGYLMLEGRTPIRVDGSSSSIKVPNNPGASYELILANQEFNQETPYGVANNTTLANGDFTGFNDISRNENSDDTAAGAQAVGDGEKFISYISAGDVDHYTIIIPAVQ